MAPSAIRRPALVIVGVATALGVFSALQAFNYVSYLYAWALLVPFMLWMARRFRFERRRCSEKRNMGSGVIS